MWGNPGHLSEMARKIRGKESDLKNVILPGEFQVLVANTNVEDYTYDGVDHGGERVAEEVRSQSSTKPLDPLISYARDSSRRIPR